MRIEDWIKHLEHLGVADAGPLPPEKTLLSGARGEQHRGQGARSGLDEWVRQWLVCEERRRAFARRENDRL